MKKNSINRDLKQHGFEIDEEWKVGQGFGNRFPMIVSSSRQWVKRVFKTALMLFFFIPQDCE
jgi:hypothetical protein